MTPHHLGTPSTRGRRASAAVEFTLTVVILLAVFLGIVELSLLMSRTYKVSRAARDACRTASGVIEGVDPTGDEIEAVAVDHARFVLDAAGITCAEGCEVQAEWFERDGWMMVRVVVDVPYDPFTSLLPVLPLTTHGEFTMLTQQQIFG